MQLIELAILRLFWVPVHRACGPRRAVLRFTFSFWGWAPPGQKSWLRAWVDCLFLLAQPGAGQNCAPKYLQYRGKCDVNFWARTQFFAILVPPFHGAPLWSRGNLGYVTSLVKERISRCVSGGQGDMSHTWLVDVYLVVKERIVRDNIVHRMSLKIVGRRKKGG